MAAQIGALFGALPDVAMEGGAGPLDERHRSWEPRFRWAIRVGAAQYLIRDLKWLDRGVR